MELEPERVHKLVREMLLERPNIFGAQGHNFLLNPPLPESKVAAFEQRHSIVLPADYRYFITRVANGGAGPFYGVFRLGEMDEKPWREGEGLVGVLSQPFPHREAWNDLSGMPPNELYDSDEDEAERQRIAFEKNYYDNKWVNGAIPICHEGCAIRIWLVVTGEEAGHLWE
ncbi:MAG TPA: SMI1/KNR4 family protein, partial [Candidatus Angelobacter sp.]